MFILPNSVGEAMLHLCKGCRDFAKEGLMLIDMNPSNLVAIQEGDKWLMKHTDFDSLSVVINMSGYFHFIKTHYGRAEYNWDNRIHRYIFHNIHYNNFQNATIPNMVGMVAHGILKFFEYDLAKVIDIFKLEVESNCESALIEKISTPVSHLQDDFSGHSHNYFIWGN